MPPTPEFSSLLVSRPGPHARLVSRLLSLAAVAALYAVALAAIVLIPLLVLESVDPPKAGVVIVFRPPPGGRHPGSSGHMPKGSRGGGASAAATAKRAVKPHAIASPTAAQTPLPEPESSVDPGPPAGPNGPDGPPGSPDGTDRPGDGPWGTPCPDCPGAGPDGPPGDPPGPYEPGTPGLTPPTLIPASRALPKYPDLARRAGIMGSVILLAVVEKDGRVGEIEVMKNGDQRWGFDLAAIDAVKQWRYQPALMNGTPVAAYIQIMVEFTLAR